MTVLERINIAKISQFLSSNYLQNAGLFGGGEDSLLPRKLYCVRKNVEWMYDNDPSNTSLYATSVYLYALCKQFVFKALSIESGGGSVAPVIPDDSDCEGLVLITEVDFEADGKTVYKPEWDGKSLQLFWNNVNRFIIPPEWQYTAGGGFKILQPPDFDAHGINSDVQIMAFIGCFNPGALFLPAQFPINEYVIVPVNSGTDYDLTWTAYYSNKYGVGNFTVEQDEGDGVWIPTSMQPSTDSDSAPTYYRFNVNNLRTKITLS